MSQEQPIRASRAYNADAEEVPVGPFEVLYHPVIDCFIVMDRDGRTAFYSDSAVLAHARADELNRQFQ